MCLYQVSEFVDPEKDLKYASRAGGASNTGVLRLMVAISGQI